MLACLAQLKNMVDDFHINSCLLLYVNSSRKASGLVSWRDNLLNVYCGRIYMGDEYDNAVHLNGT
jgi:hypothetical protein